MEVWGLNRYSISLILMDFYFVPKYLIFYASYLVFPFLIYIFWKLFTTSKKIIRIFLGVFILGSLLFIWTRFIEPQIITVQETEIEVGFSGKFILLSDIHLGIFKDQNFLERVVEKTNTIDADAVFILGDLTYWPQKEKMEEIFAPLKKINKPTYLVWGNHDSEKPGEKIIPELSQILEKNNIIVLHNRWGDTGKYKILGLGSHWAGEDNTELLNTVSEEENIIVLAHNPDSIMNYPDPKKADITFAGHTHCGQIRIPFLYKKVLPVQGNFDKGYHDSPYGKVFISCGLGESGLPMRFLNPPVIDVVILK